MFRQRLGMFRQIEVSIVCMERLVCTWYVPKIKMHCSVTMFCSALTALCEAQPKECILGHKEKCDLLELTINLPLLSPQLFFVIRSTLASYFVKIIILHYCFSMTSHTTSTITRHILTHIKHFLKRHHIY